MPLLSPSQEFEAIDAYLAAVNDILREGHIPDMVNLKDKIAQFCSNARQAAPEDRKDYLAKLDTLLTKLNACEEQIRSHQKALMENEKK